jgi:hypothetical protein
MASRSFQNPQNNFVESFSPRTVFWVSFFVAPIYLMIKGVWTHAAASLVLALCTSGFSSFVYAFFVEKALVTHYLRKGWVETTANRQVNTL